MFEKTERTFRQVSQYGKSSFVRLALAHFFARSLLSTFILFLFRTFCFPMFFVILLIFTFCHQLLALNETWDLDGPCQEHIQVSFQI